MNNNTPDTEKEQLETLVHFLMGVCGFTRQGDTQAVQVCIEEAKEWFKSTLTSRDTYWKERVRKEVETEIAEAVELTKREIKHRVERYFKGTYLSLKQQGGVHIHLEEIQEIIDDSTPPGFDLTPLQDKFNK